MKSTSTVAPELAITELHVARMKRNPGELAVTLL
jgi:hypothetical protein